MKINFQTGNLFLSVNNALDLLLLPPLTNIWMIHSIKFNGTLYGPISMLKVGSKVGWLTHLRLHAVRDLLHLPLRYEIARLYPIAELSADRFLHSKA